MSRKRAGFIDDSKINGLLETGRKAKKRDVIEIIEKSKELAGLEPGEAAILLENTDPELVEETYLAARHIKNEIYGKRLVFFAPLYISDFCINNCTYCGYRKGNNFQRRRLSVAEIIEEVKVLEEMGHKRLALECGEDPINCPMDYVIEALDTIYSVKVQNGSIRRVNVNIAATSVNNYRRLLKARIGTYILFQETYHRPTYVLEHPSGPKSDYDWHACAMDRAMEGGIDDVGLGVLFGLYDHKFEVLAILMHALHLEKTFGVGPHTISVPRLKPAVGVSLENYRHLVKDEDFKRLIAVLRLTVPYTGIILSTRERPDFRDEILSIGVSQLSAGSCTGVGGYYREKEGLTASCGTTQFNVEDHRSLDEVVSSICRSGYIPSFCTACYRTGRTGERFMELAKSGQIQNVCQPNAILTFKEFLADYASPLTRQVGEVAIARHMELVEDPLIRQQARYRLEQIEQGARDMYF